MKLWEKLFHGKERKEYEELRDDAIRNKLGADWEVIHIDAENINMNITRLMPAIRAVLKRRKKLRGYIMRAEEYLEIIPVLSRRVK